MFDSSDENKKDSGPWWKAGPRKVKISNQIILNNKSYTWL